MRDKQASNSTGFSLARETSPGVVAVDAVWLPQEPNSYKDFGGSYKMIARNPINASRQRKKGVITDLNAAGGWQEDLTFEALTDKIEGLMYADFRTKYAGVASAVAGNNVTVVSSAGVSVGDVIAITGFQTAANNGVKHVTAVAAGMLTVAEAFTAENHAGNVYRVGRVFPAADISFVAATKTLSTVVGDFTTMGLIPGEWLFLSDDVPINSLDANIGMARIKSITATSIVLDKVEKLDDALPIVDVTGVGKMVTIYHASRVIKNETGALIKRRTYQAERLLGKREDASPFDQAEYLVGSVINEAQFAFNTADKVTVDWELMAMRKETRTSDDGPKPGVRAASVEGSAFNTSTDVRRMNISVVGNDISQFAYVMDFSLTVKNNNRANKAIGVLGSIDYTEGLFAVSAAVTAYFSNVEAAQAIEDNSDVTVDVHLARDNRGIVFDLPLVSLGDGRPKIAANEPIQLPLDIDAATGAKLAPDMDHTLLVAFFDYLPYAAMA